MKEDTDTLTKNNPDYFTEKIRSHCAKKYLRNLQVSFFLMDLEKAK